MLTASPESLQENHLHRAANVQGCRVASMSSLRELMTVLQLKAAHSPAAALHLTVPAPVQGKNEMNRRVVSLVYSLLPRSSTFRRSWVRLCKRALWWTWVLFFTINAFWSVRLHICTSCTFPRLCWSALRCLFSHYKPTSIRLSLVRLKM